MRRWLLATTVLLGGTTVAVHADYIKITVNLAAQDKTPEFLRGQAGQGMMPGAGGGEPGMMFPGGAGGPPGRTSGRGMQQPPGAAGGAPGGRSSGGFGQQQPGGRGGPPAGAGGGGGDTASGSPDGGGGGPSGMQMGQRGGPGAVSGLMGGASGRTGAQPGAGGTLLNINPGDEDEPESAPVIVEAVVEVPREKIKQLPSGRIEITHKWGATRLFTEDESGAIEVKRYVFPTVRQRWDEEKKKIKENDPDRADKLVWLAEWALNHGLIKESTDQLEELTKLNPKHKAAVAYQKVKADLAKPVTRDDPAAKWKSLLGEFKEKRGEHYLLYYDGDNEAQVDSRLKRLESNMQGFYYWFAIRGEALPVPDKKLVAFLVSNKDAFTQKHKEIFEDAPQITDGFLARRENIAVFSATRLDDNYETLLRTAKEIFNKYNPSELLKGKGGGETSYLAARNQTLVLLIKALQEDSEISTVTYEGTRQLLAAVGYYPRSVLLPQWIDFGMASLFETPKGALWVGTGTPNLAFQVNFKVWDESKKLEKGGAPEALRSSLTDSYFRRISDSKNKDVALTKARTMSWALTYYLANRKPEGFKRYFQELTALPRDMEFSEEVLMTAFARAFDLTDAAKPGEVDMNKFNNLANDWYLYMRNTPVELDEVRRERSAAAKGRTTGKPGANQPSTTPKPSQPGAFIP